ncbi:DUF4367 domain-containing protein [Pseudalkalibacillus sp. R45]|uniref:DUF4367 domain-containing protein n=1 Tax=Pseudalkalibacillus sp. R45 TaxID=3457433 RepID=UPI003FCE3C54
MKKWLSMVSMLVLILAGCNSSGSLYDYDNTKLKEELEERDFQPRVPTKLPFDEGQADLNPSIELGEGQDDTVIMIDFTSSGEADRNLLGLEIVKDVEVDSDMEYETVDIGELKGQFADNEAGNMVLNWKEGNINYTLSYYKEQSDTEITKEHLIETAKSFE